MKSNYEWGSQASGLGYSPTCLDGIHGLRALYLEQNLWYNVPDEELMSGAEQASYK